LAGSAARTERCEAASQSGSRPSLLCVSSRHVPKGTSCCSACTSSRSTSAPVLMAPEHQPVVHHEGLAGPGGWWQQLQSYPSRCWARRGGSSMCPDRLILYTKCALTGPAPSRSPKLRHRGTAVTAGPRQLGTKAAGQAGSPRRAALAEPHAASTSLLSQRPTHPAHRPGRARPRGPSRRRQAAVKVRNGRPDVPAGCLRAACRAGAACCRSLCCAAARCLSARGLLQRPHPCSNPVQSGSSRGC
jgi:hypothetical protein